MTEGRLTLAEFLARPETNPPSEYVDGVVVQKPALEGREQWLRVDLATLLYGWARASHQGAVASGIRLTLGNHSYVVDVVYYAPGRLPAGASDREATTTPPDLAVEVCPSAVDPAWVAAKLAYCVAHGVRLGWLVDPAEETVTVHRPDHAAVILRRGAMLEAPDILPRFYLHVDDLFDVLENESP